MTTSPPSLPAPAHAYTAQLAGKALASMAQIGASGRTIEYTELGSRVTADYGEAPKAQWAAHPVMRATSCALYASMGDERRDGRAGPPVTPSRSGSPAGIAWQGRR
jgi:hypothetical protein